ncbi:CPY1 [Symbiodinium sp. CCMP2592]|nr:CPY1 [Symbiodinium sp. CCMP2592]
MGGRHAGAAAAAAVRALADDARATPIAADQARRSPPLRRGRRRARRRKALSDNSAPPPSEEGEGGVPVCPANAEAPDTMHASASVPGTAWATLDAVDLVAELRCPVPTLQDVPPFMRPPIRMALLFLLAPRMLLARTTQRGAQGRQELLARAKAFQQGDWARFLGEVRRAASSFRKSGAQSADAETLAERKREQACTKVKAGELSRARQLLTAAELAPGSEE